MTPIELYSKKPSEAYQQKLRETEGLLKQVVQDYPSLVQATSLGVEDMVITDIIRRLKLPITISMLDTKRLHEQTLTLKEYAETHYDMTIHTYYPDNDKVKIYVKKNGLDGFYNSLELRKECCHIRKIIPLQALRYGHDGWLTGLRKEQSDFRADLQAIEDENPTNTHQPQVKINPILEWTMGDIWHYVKEHNVPYNKLHDEFYVSIGCEPCTRAITLGEDFRAGRWWWEQDDAKECGLHVHESSSSLSKPAK